jgi:hypothetical protein
LAPSIYGQGYTVLEDIEEGIILSNNQRKLARTSDGVLHFVWSRSNGTRFKIYLMYSLDNSTTWNLEQVSAPPDNYNQYNPSIAVDSIENININEYLKKIITNNNS